MMINEYNYSAARKKSGSYRRGRPRPMLELQTVTHITGITVRRTIICSLTVRCHLAAAVRRPLGCSLQRTIFQFHYKTVRPRSTRMGIHARRLLPPGDSR